MVLPNILVLTARSAPPRLWQDDHMYAPRLAPYMAVHLSTLVWRLVESAVRGKAVAKGEVRLFTHKNM